MVEIVKLMHVKEGIPPSGTVGVIVNAFFALMIRNGCESEYITLPGFVRGGGGGANTIL